MALFITIAGLLLLVAAALVWWMDDSEHQLEVNQLYQKFAHDAAKSTHIIRENVPADADALQASANYLVDLVENNRLISLLESQRIPRELVDLAGVAQSVILRHSSEAEKKNVDLYYQGGDTAPNVWGSELEFTRALSNLVDNGIKYRDPDAAHSNVALSIRSTAKQVTVEVANNGIPIPPEMQERIFDFVALKNSGTIHIPGTGLGLFVVKRITEKYKGTLTFHSSPAGTTFVIELPIARA